MKDSEASLSDNSVRPTKKQRDLLTYIEQFINQHGYSPSYREIMNGLSYSSVATVALHVNSLISRGHLRKRDRSARSLEVVVPTGLPAMASYKEVADVSPAEDKWLAGKIDALFATAEATKPAAASELGKVIDVLRLLGLGPMAESFAARLSRMDTTPADNPQERA